MYGLCQSCFLVSGEYLHLFYSENVVTWGESNADYGDVYGIFSETLNLLSSAGFSNQSLVSFPFCFRVTSFSGTKSVKRCLGYIILVTPNWVVYFVRIAPLRIEVSISCRLRGGRTRSIPWCCGFLGRNARLPGRCSRS